jgi:hypothetical protein
MTFRLRGGVLIRRKEMDHTSLLMPTSHWIGSPVFHRIIRMPYNSEDIAEGPEVTQQIMDSSRRKAVEESLQTQGHETTGLGIGLPLVGRAYW